MTEYAAPHGKQLVTATAPIPDGTPRIAGSPSGETLLVWDDNGTSDIYVRLYRGSSLPAGPEVDLVRSFSTYVGTGQIAFAPGDQVVIGWTNFVDTGRNGYNISFDRIPASLLRHP